MPDLFKSCLGDQFEQLAPLVRKAHTGRIRLEGDVTVERGNWIANLICKLFGMPPAAPKCKLVVNGNHDQKTMTWNRFFDDFAMNSFFYKDRDYLVEQLGPIHMKMAVNVTDGVLTYTLDKTRILGIPIPKCMGPRVIAVEEQAGDQYRFSVLVSMPVVGKLISYFGDMSVETV
jgi:hypothetical protein